MRSVGARAWAWWRRTLVRRGGTALVAGVASVLACLSLLPASGAEFRADTTTSGSSVTAATRFLTGALAGFGTDASYQTGYYNSSRQPVDVRLPTETDYTRNWSTTATSTHACGLRNGGQLWCWGSNDRGQLGTGDGLDRGLALRVGLATWTSVDTGGSHTCGIQSTGSLWCWGNNDSGQLGLGTTTNAVVPTQVGVLTTWTQVSTGTDHTCGRRGTALQCWGANTDGRVGVTASTRETSPVTVVGGHSWRAVTAGGASTCGIRSTNELYCWGSDTSDQLGRGTGVQTTNVPTAVSNVPTNWSSVTVGTAHACGLRNDGAGQATRLYCWGSNTYGQLGQSDQVSKTVPTTTEAESWLSVAAGTDHTCGIKNAGTLFCWGLNDRGQVGISDATSGPWSNPRQIGSGTNWKAVAATGDNNCAMRDQSTSVMSPWCWGANDEGQIGREAPNGLQPKSVPFVGDAANKWTSLAAGDDHSCGTRSDYKLYCWGAGDRGQLGFTSGVQQSPVHIGINADFVSAAAGDGFTCAATRDGRMWCGGQNASGQLGLNDRTNRDSFGQVGGLDWSTVSAGTTHACALTSEGRLFCWGNGANGRLGLGDTTDRLVPTEVNRVGGVAWASVSAGGSHTCAVRTDGTAYCWGLGSSGQVGDNTATQRTSPVALTGGAVWRSVAAGKLHSCATRTNNTLYCWGANTQGQLGDTTTTQRNAPTQVAGSTWSAVTAGAQHTCGTSTTNTLWCWGAAGAAGVASGTQTSTPLQVPGIHDLRLAVTGPDAGHTLLAVPLPQ